MRRVLEVDRPRWSSGDASFVVELLEATGAKNVDARRVRGSVDLRFDDVEEENAFEEPDVRAFVRDLYHRAPWAAYYVFPSQDQLTMYLMAHGASLAPRVDGPFSIVVRPEVISAFQDVLTAAAVYAVEHGDDWRQVVESWPDEISGSFRYHVRKVLAAKFDRHAGLRLTSEGWVGPDE